MSGKIQQVAYDAAAAQGFLFDDLQIFVKGGLFVGLVGVPAVAAVITYDGTRVFVGVSAAAFAFTVVWMARTSEDLGQTAVTDGLARLTLATSVGLVAD